MKDGFPEPYSALVQQIFANWQKETTVTHASDVAEAVWLAANDASSPFMIPAGEDAIEWYNARSR